MPLVQIGGVVLVLALRQELITKVVGEVLSMEGGSPRKLTKVTIEYVQPCAWGVGVVPLPKKICVRLRGRSRRNSRGGQRLVFYERILDRHNLRSATADAKLNRSTTERNQPVEARAQPDLEVEIFTGPNCIYCQRAKAVLVKQNLQYREVDVSIEEGRNEMQRRLPRARSIPQIFIGGKHIGGYEDLARLDARGSLRALTTDRHP